jgi:hypothetical protein
MANRPMVKMNTYLRLKCPSTSGLESPNSESLLYPDPKALVTWQHDARSRALKVECRQEG